MVIVALQYEGSTGKPDRGRICRSALAVCLTSSHRGEFEMPSASRKPRTATPSISKLDNLDKRLGDALLDWLGSLDRHFLGECQKLLILRGDRFEPPAPMRGRKLD